MCWVSTPTMWHLETGELLLGYLEQCLPSTQQTQGKFWIDGCIIQMCKETVYLVVFYSCDWCDYSSPGPFCKCSLQSRTRLLSYFICYCSFHVLDSPHHPQHKWFPERKDSVAYTHTLLHHGDVWDTDPTGHRAAEQGRADFLFNGPISKYFRFCG